MQNKSFFARMLHTVAAAALVFSTVVMGFTSCNQDDDAFAAITKSKPASVENFDITTDRDAQNGTATIVESIDGVTKRDTTVTIPLGNVQFSIDKIDTVFVTNNNLEHVSFKLDEPSTENYETNGVYYTRTTRKFIDKYDKYEKHGQITYLDAYMYVWGQKVEFPAANGLVSYLTVSTADRGTKGKYAYTLCTSEYETSFRGSKQSNEQGFYMLAIEQEDKLISGPTKTDEGFEVVKYDNDGNPSTERSWIELTEVWSLSGEKKSTYEVMLYSTVEAPAYDIKVLSTFNIEQINQTVGNAVDAGTRKDGNFQIIKKQTTQTVGNDKFTKNFVYSYEKATLNLGGKNFEMPFEAYQGITDKSFTMQAMSPIDGYDRMLNTHSVAATFAGKPVKAKAETEIRVPESKDELVDTKITGEGFDYVNPTTSNAWIEVTETWTKSGKKVYKKDVNLTNGITAPAKVTKILDNFDLTQVNAQLGSETLTNTRTVGDFTVKTYTCDYTVGNNKFQRVFKLTYEKATYNPLNHAMIWKGYEDVQDNGFTLGNMSDLTEGDKTYLRKSYTHGMSASFNDHSASSKAEAELRVETSDELKSRTVTNEGFDYVNPTTSNAWIEVTEVWSLSGTKKYKKSVNLTNGITAPEKITKILDSFNLNKVNATLGSETKGASRTEGDFTITKYTRKYTVGNNKFTREFTLSYEKATYNPLSHAMISKAYENVQDGGFTTADMSNTTSNGKTYLRKSYTHSMSATFNSHDANSKAEAELWVETNDELKSRKVTDEGFDYVNPTTSNAWIEVTEVWSLSGTKKYKKSVNLTNGITAPEKVTKILDSFNLNKVNATLGSETKGSSRTDGDFTVTTYTRNYTVGNDKFTRTFVLKYEKAVYKPMNHAMISKAYENVQDGGFSLGNMSNTTSNGKEYERKSYTHNMSASFNNHDASSKAEAELWVEKVEERETPHWLGAPVSAKYTRVQRKTGEQFMDMVVFTYQNGVVMAPNGVVDMSLIYAFDQSVASKNGVETCLKNASYSGVWTGSKWAPAGITITNGRWIYAGKNAAWDHTVMENNAITLGIGVDVTPTPKAQSYSISGNKITIKYAKNNGSTTANTSLELR